MASPTPTELKAFIRICAGTARDLKKALRAEQIYVATGSTTSAVPFSHLTKAFQVHAAVLTLCRNGFGSEAFALSRLILEMSMALRWITNQDQVKRSDSFAFFEAKRKLYFAMIYEKGNSTGRERSSTWKTCVSISLTCTTRSNSGQMCRII